MINYSIPGPKQSQPIYISEHQSFNEVKSSIRVPVDIMDGRSQVQF